MLHDMHAELAVNLKNMGLFVFLLILLPFIIIAFAGRTLPEAYYNLEAKSELIKLHQRVILICKHLAEQCKEVTEDLKYVNEHLEDLKSLIVANCIEKYPTTVVPEDSPETRLYVIFKDSKLTQLSADLNTVADKFNSVAHLAPLSKKASAYLKQFENESDIEIARKLLEPVTVEACQDLVFVKEYIDGKYN